MSHDPILLIGGSGIVGRWTAHWLRQAHPELPLLIGGRDLEKARVTARAIGHADAVAVDLGADDLGLGERRISAVAVYFTDMTTAALGFAQTRGVPYISISPAIHEVGPELAAYMYRPDAAPVVLGTEWLVGATTVPALRFARAFGHIDRIHIGALLDGEDSGGPASYDDLERQTSAVPAVLGRRNGTWFWRTGEDAKGAFQAVDGTMMAADALSPHDVVTLATVTGAPTVQFDLAQGVSSSRRRGEPMSTEIIVDLEGSDHSGKPLHTRHAVTHPQGQMPLTGLGVALVLERLLGLSGESPVSPGLYFPYQLLNEATYFKRFDEAGGHIQAL